MDDKQMYGIWITGKGWLKGKSDVISFHDYSFAHEVANILQAQVRMIDESYDDLEKFYLECENKRKSKWHIFKNLFKNKIDKSNSRE